MDTSTASKMKVPLLSADYGVMIDVNESSSPKINKTDSEDEGEDQIDSIEPRHYDHMLVSTYFLAFFYYLMLPWLFGAYIALLEKFVFHKDVPCWITYVVATLLFCIQYYACRCRLDNVLRHIEQSKVKYSELSIENFSNLIQLRWYLYSIGGLMASYAIAMYLIYLYGDSKYTLTITMSTSSVILLSAMLTVLYFLILCCTIGKTTTRTDEEDDDENNTTSTKKTVTLPL